MEPDEIETLSCAGNSHSNMTVRTSTSSRAGTSSTRNANSQRSKRSGEGGSHASSNSRKNNSTKVPFHPKGGVTSLINYDSTKSSSPSPIVIPTHQNLGPKGLSPLVNSTGINAGTVWILYGDGTAVRLPRLAFFPTNHEEDIEALENIVHIVNFN